MIYKNLKNLFTAEDAEEFNGASEEDWKGRKDLSASSFKIVA